uniref:Uncharacterized protein n=1 Tax=Arundo donax TaxID=35708 RepID=A0A0A8ZWK8_ARUDO
MSACTTTMLWPLIQQQYC